MKQDMVMMPDLNSYDFSKLHLVCSVRENVTDRHEKSGNLGDPRSRKILQIAEDLNKNIKLFLQKNIRLSKQMSKVIKV